MIALVQRVNHSSVCVDGKTIAEIEIGMTVFLGVLQGDTQMDVQKLVNKIVHLRIFADEKGKMNRSLLDIGGAMLVVSQFTLGANIKRGRRPSFDDAAEPDDAKKLYVYFIEQASAYVEVCNGEFGADMQVEIHNDGPVTLIVDSKVL